MSILLTIDAEDQDVRPESIIGLGDEGAIRPRLTIRGGLIGCCFTILIRLKSQSKLLVAFFLIIPDYFSLRKELIQINTIFFDDNMSSYPIQYFSFLFSTFSQIFLSLALFRSLCLRLGKLCRLEDD